MKTAKADPGVYVHVPFCRRLCPYCAFAVAVDQDHLEKEYVRAVLSEARSRKESIAASARSLHLGGGTPSRLSEEALRGLIRGLEEILPLTGDCERTLEANPEDVSPGKASIWRELGFSRISLGAQSFNLDELKTLGRVHVPEGIRSALKTLRQAGIPNLNLDLIAGGGPTKTAWMDSLHAAADLEPEHLSFYILEYEEGTMLSRRKKELRWSSREEGEVLVQARTFLESRGYEWYELSNYARPGRRSTYNDGFWKGGDVLGLGPSAASTLGRLRRRGRRRLKDYLEDPTGAEESESLDDWSLTAEALIRGLRTRDGVDLTFSPLREAVLSRAEEPEFKPLLLRSGDRLQARDQGRLLADGLAEGLMPPREGSYIQSHELSAV